MNRIPVYLPSMNRAPQLRLLLESIDKNMPDIFKFNVVWKAENEKYRQGYEKLFKEEWVNKHAIFKEQEGIGADQFWAVLNAAISDEKYCGLFSMFTDDCVCYRPPRSPYTVEEVKNLFTDDVWCVGFRHGLNTRVHNYLTGQTQAPLDLLPEGLTHEEADKNSRFIKWDWTKRDPWENYGFYCGSDGTVYRATELKDCLEGFTYTSPHEIEHYLCHFGGREKARKRPCMVSPVRSNIFCQQINATRANVTFGNWFYKSLEELNDKYLNDEVIDINSMNFNIIKGCHCEVPFGFRRI